MREKKREKYLEAERWAPEQPSTDLRSAIYDDLRRALTTSDDKGRTSNESTTTRQGRWATKRAAPASDVTVDVSPWDWFALGLGFGFLYIGFFFFINKSVLQYWVMGFGLLLLCMDCIWFSLPTTWPWIDFWFALYWFFFFLFFGWESMGLLPPDYVGLGLPWAMGLALLPIFFFFFLGFFFLGGLESRIDNFFFF